MTFCIILDCEPKEIDIDKLYNECVLHNMVNHNEKITFSEYCDKLLELNA